MEKTVIVVRLSNYHCPSPPNHIHTHTHIRLMKANSSPLHSLSLLLCNTNCMYELYFILHVFIQVQFTCIYFTNLYHYKINTLHTLSPKPTRRLATAKWFQSTAYLTAKDRREKQWLIQFVGIFLSIFVSYEQSARQDIRNIFVKIWKGSNTEEYKITVSIKSIALPIVPTKKVQLVRKNIYNVWNYGSLKLI